MLAYEIEITPDDNDTVFITVPKLPEVTTFASADGDQRFLAARAAIGEALAGRIAKGLEVPDGDPEPIPGADHWVVFVDPQTNTKVELYRALAKAGLTRADLQRRLGWHREQVDRLFRLDHASRLDQLSEAFAKLDLRIAVTAVPVVPNVARATVLEGA